TITYDERRNSQERRSLGVGIWDLELGIWDFALREPKSALRDRQRPDALAGRREDRVRQRRQHRWQCRLAESGRRIVRDQEVDVDCRRRLAHTNRLERVEVALDH